MSEAAANVTKMARVENNDRTIAEDREMTERDEQTISGSVCLSLEVDILALRSATSHGLLPGVDLRREKLHDLLEDHLWERLNLLNLMGCAEAIEIKYTHVHCATYAYFLRATGD